jgi:drug/metabolite transporter (DMT)-like permease
MSWITLAVSAALSWGLYGASLSRGQAELGNPLRAMLCVGVAYFLMAVLVPVGALTSQGEFRNFTTIGVVTATIAGALGALGAVFITYAFRAGGSPTVVMPIVFGGAPLVNVIATMIIAPPKDAPNPLFFAGVLLASIGAGMVLYFRPGH